jgi:hypothetical protein
MNAPHSATHCPYTMRTEEALSDMTPGPMVAVSGERTRVRAGPHNDGCRIQEDDEEDALICTLQKLMNESEAGAATRV